MNAMRVNKCIITKSYSDLITREIMEMHGRDEIKIHITPGFSINIKYPLYYKQQ